ncbi:Signal peptide peptidase-like 2 [Sesamum angolense]|uniref:Signal peptide peptidase-like 2 n=1 Tax=Sesamum angolense TaxID=2727404 RepID=A0AAE2BL07_9LAMI|nr:Signal peptide peptidase-like 2 [Sesamum angolense]
MGFRRIWSLICVCAALLVWLSSPTGVTAGDIVHDDDSAPKKPGCENDFVLVKVQTWVNGVEDEEFVVLVLDLFAGDVIMVDRGNCKFTTKANFAEALNCTRWVCEPDETDLDIHIPAVMLPQDAGATLEKMLSNGSSVSVQLYSPRRPVVDIAEVFLWLMAVGTILCASYWSAWSAREAAIEQDKLLKDATDELPNIKSPGGSSVVDINTMSAILFVVVASCFLILIYKLMSYWFIELLVVLFCIGGVEGLQTCLVALLSRWFKRAGESFIKVPVLGAISYLTLAVAPFCIALAVVWAVYRNVSFAWIGQDILGIALIITVLQIVRIPNLKSSSGGHSPFELCVHLRHLLGVPFQEAVQRKCDDCGGIIGFGDILLPGLLVAFSLRYDWLANKSLRAGYFLWAMFAYGLGLLITYVALNLMDGHGQPALLYIVPFTLGTFLALGRKRGELKVLWTRGEPLRVCPHVRLESAQDL